MTSWSSSTSSSSHESSGGKDDVSMDVVVSDFATETATPTPAATALAAAAAITTFPAVVDANVARFVSILLPDDVDICLHLYKVVLFCNASKNMKVLKTPS